MFQRIIDEIDTYFGRDPAARSRLEVALTYPGFHALLGYRLSHWLWRHEMKLLARMVSYFLRMFTGIEIHPAAVIGKNLFIDHGAGVVIGETTKIGDDVTIYQSVTLGGTAWEKGVRHPQVGDGVIIGAGAQVLGPISLGAGARIGANAVVVKDVPPGATAIGVPARLVGETIAEGVKPAFDPYGLHGQAALEPLFFEVEALKKQLADLEERLKQTCD